MQQKMEVKKDRKVFLVIHYLFEESFCNFMLNGFHWNKWEPDAACTTQCFLTHKVSFRKQFFGKFGITEIYFVEQGKTGKDVQYDHF